MSEDAPEQEAREKDHKPAQVVPVVAIGSSAGGYEATKELFSGLPSDTGMAFVVVPHLDPSHESHLSDLLRRDTSMPVTEAKDGQVVEADHVYVIAPNTTMGIEDGKLHVAQRIEAKDRVVHVIDRFFKSVADSYEERAIGLVLSGALADGTQGVRDIKAAGGFVLVQDPETAAFPEMPRSAIKTGVVDVSGAPLDLAHALTDLKRSLHGPATIHEEEIEDQDDARALNRILDAVHRATGSDFRDYKRTTIMRRIHRRMIATKNLTLRDYAKFIATSPDEPDRLHREILILVTSFFRDEVISNAIVSDVLPELLKDRAYNDPVRVWVAGCSTGEEAYSMAILITEYMERNNLTAQLNIFATDLSSTAIQVAREGAYPETIAEKVSEERLARFFEPYGKGYRIRKHIRSMCVFAEHNLVSDPPFSNMDIASCRNMLVYMQPSLQRRALEALHYSLKRNGILVLGNAESMGRNKDLFRPITGARNILIKRDAPTPRVQDYIGHRVPFPPRGSPTTHEGDPNVDTLDKEADRLLLERYAPPGVVVDYAMKVVYFRGKMSPFLKHRPGPANLDLMQMAPESLSLKVREAVKKVEQSGAPDKRKVIIDHDGKSVTLVIEAVALPQKGSHEKYYLITFNDDLGQYQARQPVHVRKGSLMDLFVGQNKRELEEQIERLKKELQEARQHLKHVSADHEAAIEELRSANEEAISTNEELQSTNEELETTKEELQSTNEELTTLNEELHVRNKELQDTNNDLFNLLQSVELPIIMLGADLKIRRFTERARDLFNLIQMDVDRPLTDIQANFDASSLKPDLVKVLTTYQRVERTIEVKEGVVWNLKIHPYRTSDNVVEGIVLIATEENAG